MAQFVWVERPASVTPSESSVCRFLFPDIPLIRNERARGDRLADRFGYRYADEHTKILARRIDMNETSTTAPSFGGPTDLVTAVAQDAASGEVLMVAHMNREAWEETLRTGQAVYFSRGRQRLWRKGEESGNIQRVREVFVDCDGDAVLLKVEQVGGAACHEGYPACFFRQVTPGGLQVVAERVFDPEKVYKKGS
jgi:phosphoribosyl-AMP cyclohydrolase